MSANTTKERPINVEVLILDGIEYPVNYNMMALERFNRLYADAEVVGETENAIRLIHFMMGYGAERMGEDFGLSVDDVADIIGMDDANAEACTEIIEYFMTPKKNRKQRKAAASKTKRKTKTS